MASGPMVKISFRLDPRRWGGIVGENLWAEQVGRNRFRLANIPVHVHGVSLRDVVFARARRDRLVFSGVSLRGGHSTCWVARRDEAESAAFGELWARLVELGCGSEGLSSFRAIDVPPPTDLRAVEELLEEGFAAGVWSYEVAHRGHVVTAREGGAP